MHSRKQTIIDRGITYNWNGGGASNWLTSFEKSGSVKLHQFRIIDCILFYASKIYHVDRGLKHIVGKDEIEWTLVNSKMFLENNSENAKKFFNRRHIK